MTSSPDRILNFMAGLVVGTAVTAGFVFVAIVGFGWVPG